MMFNSAVVLLTLFNCIDGAQKHMANVLSPLSQKVVANISHEKTLLEKLVSIATTDDDSRYGTSNLHNAPEETRVAVVESFNSVVNLLDEGDKEFIQTHLAHLPHAEIHSMVNELVGMSKPNMKNILEEMLLFNKTKKEEDSKWWGSCNRRLHNCARCTQSCGCTSGRCSWKFQCVDTNGKGFNGCLCVMDHSCKTGRCAANLRCAPKLSNGYSCLEDDDCRTGVCSWGLKCVDAGQNGGYCFEDDDCHSGRCAKNLKCADKLNEFEVCWKGGNDCKTGSKCISVASIGTGICLQDKTSECMKEAISSVPTSLKESVLKVTDTLVNGVSNDVIAGKIGAFLKQDQSKFKEVVAGFADCITKDDVRILTHHDADSDQERFIKALKKIPALVFMLSADVANIIGIEIEMGFVVGPVFQNEEENYVPAIHAVLDICGSVGTDISGDVGIEMGAAFVKTPDDIGGWTNCLTAEAYALNGGGAYICGSGINYLTGRGNWNWEIGLAVGGGFGGGLNFAACHSYKFRFQ